MLPQNIVSITELLGIPLNFEPLADALTQIPLHLFLGGFTRQKNMRLDFVVTTKVAFQRDSESFLR